MKCVLSGPNARIFAKAVQSLSKFGRDLYLEADPNGCQLRSVNANKSAVGTFKFFKNFFESYDTSGGSSSDENYCRLSIKACLGLFKNMKQVEKCQITIDSVRSKLFVQMNCRLETVKHYIISIIDDDNISADVPMDDTPNSIQGSCKIFSGILSNFQTGEEEITIEARNETLTIKNYVEGSRVNEKFMRSQLKMPSSEFDEYNITEETSVTFCLREFKAFLLFCDALYENVNILFRDAGSPIIFKIKKTNFFEATLIMSTLSPDDVTMCEDIQPREFTESFISRQANTTAQKRKPTKDPPKQSKRPSSTTQTETSSESTPSFRFDAQSIDLPRNHASASTSDDLPRVPDINAAHSESEVFVTFMETEENVADDEQIPQSPGRSDSTERKALRSIFSRCFEATYVPRGPSPNSLMFVPDSDED